MMPLLDCYNDGVSFLFECTPADFSLRQSLRHEANRPNHLLSCISVRVSLVQVSSYSVVRGVGLEDDFRISLAH